MLITTALLLQPLLADPITTEPLFTTLAPIAQAAKASSKKPTTPQELSWKFVEVHVQLRDIDLLDDTLGGAGVRGAWQFDEGIFVKGGVDLYTNDEDVTRYDIGVGQSVSIRSDASAFAAISWVWEDPDSGDTEDGWRIEGGFRAIFDAHLGGEIRVGYADIADDGFVYGADLRYWFVPQVAFGVGYEHEVDDDLWTIALRYAF
jgi:hypothetical protein